MGRPGDGSTPDRSTIRQRHCLTRRRHRRFGTVMPGLRPVLVKGIQAALTRRSDPPLTKLAPLSPRGKGADDPHPSFRKEVESGPSQKPWSAAR
jgi:hypothetical protein